jgi:hypothetical protein
MRYLLTALVVCCATASAADIPAPRDSAAGPAGAAVPGSPAAPASIDVSKCFKVRRLLKTDSTHYWADWSNTCPYTIDAVYVMVGFRDRSHKDMGNGVWPMYFVKPGAHRVTRFSAPVADFETVRVHRITTDSVIALRPEPSAPVEHVVPPTRVGDTAIGKVIPDRPQTARNQTKY